MIKEKNILNITALGVFLLLWGPQAFLIAGENGKYLVLFFGVFLLLLASLKRKFQKQEIRFYVFSFSFYMVYLLIAFIQDQKTTDTLSLTFGIINFFLLCAGYSLGLKNYTNLKLSNKIITLISVLAFVGTLKFIQLQTNYTIGFVDRGIGDSVLNPVGVAYSNSLLILFLYWLFKNTEKKILKYIISLSFLLAFFVLISTLSRGALLFTISILIINYFKGVKQFVLFLVKFFKLSLIISFLALIVFFVSQNFDFLKIKIDGILERFSQIFTFLDKNEGDLSISGRRDYYNIFKEEFQNFIFFGQYGYTPYPHNQFLEIIMRWGLFGVPLLFFSINKFLISLKLLYSKNLIKNNMLFLMTFLFVFSYLQSMSSLSLEMNRTLWLGFGFISSNKFSHKD